MKKTLGFIELNSYIGALICLDCMLKNTFVELHKIEKIDSAIVTVIIKGNLSDVQTAINIAKNFAKYYAYDYQANIIANPLINFI